LSPISSPATPDSIESILKWHLVPTLGPKRLDAITNEQVQRLKLALSHRAPKTVNSVFDGAEYAVEEGDGMGRARIAAVRDQVIAQSQEDHGFHDFNQYERLLTVARKRGTDAYLMVLAGGAGARRRKRTEWSELAKRERNARSQTGCRERRRCKRTEWSELAKRERNEGSQAGCRGAPPM
jgi:hypothetical protein